MTNRILFFAAIFVCAATTAAAQNVKIKSHYVSRAFEDGTIYHTMPSTLFADKDNGDLTFDITYKENSGGKAVVNFTYMMEKAMPADSVRFTSGRTVISAPAEKLYMEPEKKTWKHRYSFKADMLSLCTFFDENAVPEAIVYSAGVPYTYKVKRSAWKSYAPIGYKIFEMIRVNEESGR